MSRPATLQDVCFCAGILVMTMGTQSIVIISQSRHDHAEEMAQLAQNHEEDARNIAEAVKAMRSPVIAKAPKPRPMTSHEHPFAVLPFPTDTMDGEWIKLGNGTEIRTQLRMRF